MNQISPISFIIRKSRVKVWIFIITCTTKKILYLTPGHKSITTYCTKSIDSKSNLTKKSQIKAPIQTDLFAQLHFS